MKGPAVAVGKTTLTSEGKWRCGVCTFANLNSEYVCCKCKEPKQAMKEKPVRVQSQV